MNDGRPQFSLARAADALHLSAAVVLAPGRRQVAVHYTYGEPGHMALLLDGSPVDEIDVEGLLPFAIQHGGAGLRIGYDIGLPVSALYSPPARFSGTVHFVRYQTGGNRTAPAAEDIRTALHGD